MNVLPEMRRLQLEQRPDGILIVRFNRPERRNAIDTATCLDLRDLFLPLKFTPGDLRCIVLTGVGDLAFSAGGDLKERDGMSDDQWRAQHAIIEESAYAVLECAVPTIAAVNGLAFGGGCELALCCDFIHAATTARFALPEVTRGIMPGAGGTQNLPRAVGARRAKEILLTGAPFSATEARDWGMVNALHDPGDLMPAVLALAERIAANAPISVRQIKTSVQHGMQTDLTRALLIEVQAYAQTIPTEDRREGVRAFNEKRVPRFMGR